MPKDISDETHVDRRGLLKALGGSAAGTAVTAVAGTAAAPATANAAESAAERVKARYRLTDHIKAYYRTNRY